MMSFYRRALGGVCAAMAALALLASCGGGDQVDPFDPNRMLVFGDEASVITEDGYKYTINQFDDGQLVCDENPNWVQYVALSFDLPFEGCNPDNETVRNIIYATPGAKVADLKTQIDAHLAKPGEGFGNDDLVMIMIGQNDIIEQYQRYPGVDRDTLIDTVQDLGRDVAEQVRRIVDADGKVIISVIPFQRITPYARSQGSANADLLGDLGDAFNSALRLALPGESGRNLGLVSADRITRLAEDNPDNYGYDNVDDPACTVALPNCTTDTLVDDADDDDWLWADPFQLSPEGHYQIGRQALSRARNNPF